MFNKLAALTLLFLSITPLVRASWLSDITGVNINVNTPTPTITFGPPNLAAIPQMLQNLPTDAAQFFLNPVGGALATAIRNAKEQAKLGCRPMPADIQETLSRFYPRALMSGVCYNTFDPQRVALDNLLLRDFTNVGAVTLEDVVVFRNRTGPTSPDDKITWAHELMHVVQYRRLGLEGFANLYTYQFDALESEAYNMQNLVDNQLTAERIQGQQQQQYWAYTNGESANVEITAQQYSQYARVAINPRTCATFSPRYIPSPDSPFGGAWFVDVTNNCPVAVRITSMDQQDQKTGVVRNWPCNIQICLVPAGATQPYIAFGKTLAVFPAY